MAGNNAQTCLVIKNEGTLSRNKEVGKSKVIEIVMSIYVNFNIGTNDFVDNPTLTMSYNRLIYLRSLN